MTIAVVTGVADLLELYARFGDDPYGEDVTQTSHALQAAALAAEAGAPDPLVAAALLHDVGHLLGGPHRDGWRDDVDDDHHEAVGARLLGRLFGHRVAAPVALHVCAKRWRCAKSPAYLEALSATSRATLLAQGGPMPPEGCARFEAHPRFADALALREWDDLAKDPQAQIATSLDAYAPLLVTLLRAA